MGKCEILQLAEGLVPPHIRKAAEENMVELVFPEQLDGERLQVVLNDYLSWAELFGRDSRTMALFYRQTQGLPPMVDEMAPSRIRSQVRKMVSEQFDKTRQTDPIFKAGLILAMTQYYDLQEDELGGQLGNIVEMEKKLYRQLREGQEEGLPGPQILTPPTDTGTVKTEERLVAWSLLAAKCSRLSSFWVTTSLAVIEYLIEAAEMELVDTIKPVSTYGPGSLEVYGDCRDPGSDNGRVVFESDKVQGSAMVLFRISNPRGKFPFNRLAQTLSEPKCQEIRIGWLKT